MAMLKKMLGYGLDLNQFPKFNLKWEDDGRAHSREFFDEWIIKCRELIRGNDTWRTSSFEFADINDYRIPDKYRNLSDWFDFGTSDYGIENFMIIRPLGEYKWFRINNDIDMFENPGYKPVLRMTNRCIYPYINLIRPVPYDSVDIEFPAVEKYWIPCYLDSEDEEEKNSVPIIPITAWFIMKALDLFDTVEEYNTAYLSMRPCTLSYWS